MIIKKYQVFCIGGGDWYVESFITGGIKVGLFVFTKCTIAVIMKEKDATACSIASVVLFVLPAIIWWIVDIFRFGVNTVPDGNHIGLAPW